MDYKKALSQLLISQGYDEAANNVDSIVAYYFGNAELAYTILTSKPMKNNKFYKYEVEFAIANHNRPWVSPEYDGYWKD